MFRRGFIVLALLLSVLANSLAHAAIAMNKPAEDTTTVTSFGQSDSKNDSQGSGTADCKIHGQGCSQAHQLGAVPLAASLLNPAAQASALRWANDSMRTGPEPAPLLEPPSA